MRVWIDQRECIGNGICTELAGEVIALDGDKAYVWDGRQLLTSPEASAPVPPGLEEAVVAAAEECPAACIYLESS